MRILLIIAVITGLCIGMFNPFFSMYLESYEASDTMIGISATLYFLCVALCGLWGMSLLVRYGVRFVLILGLTISSIAALWFYVMPSVELSFLVRMMLGAGLGFYMSSMQTAILQEVKDDEYGKVSAVYAVCFGMGMGAGAIIATEFYGQDGVVPLLFGFSLILLGLILSVFFINKAKYATDFHSDNGGDSDKLIKNTVNNWKVIALQGAFVYGVVEAVLLTLYPVYWMRSDLALESLGLALGLLVVGGLVATPLAGWFADKNGERITLLMLSLLALPVISLLTLLDSSVFLMVSAFATGATVGPIFAISMAVIGNARSHREKAAGSSGFTLAFGAGCIVGPLLSAWLMFMLGDKAIFLFSLLVLAIFVANVSLMNKAEVRQLS